MNIVSSKLVMLHILYYTINIRILIVLIHYYLMSDTELIHVMTVCISKVQTTFCFLTISTNGNKFWCSCSNV